MNSDNYSPIFLQRFKGTIVDVTADRVVEKDFQTKCIEIEEAMHKLKSLVEANQPTIGTEERKVAFERIVELEDLTKRYSNQNLSSLKNLAQQYLDYYLNTIYHIDPKFYSDLNYDQKDELSSILQKIDIIEANKKPDKSRLGDVVGSSELNTLKSKLEEFIKKHSLEDNELNAA